MNPVTENTVIVAAFGTVATPGTVTSTGVDWSPTYEPDIAYYASCGAISSGGTVVAHVQGSNQLSTGYTSIGSVTFNDAAGGTTTKTAEVPASEAVYRYYRSYATVTGGTVSGFAANFVGKPRTVS